MKPARHRAAIFFAVFASAFFMAQVSHAGPWWQPIVDFLDGVSGLEDNPSPEPTEDDNDGDGHESSESSSSEPKKFSDNSASSDALEKAIEQSAPTGGEYAKYSIRLGRTLSMLSAEQQSRVFGE